MMGEYESEPIRGLPEVPPEGEHILWQGGPRWQSLAKNVFHVRKVAAYFAALIAIYSVIAIANGRAVETLLGGISWQISLGLATIGILAVLAWFYARTTCYTITDRRLVMRFGVAIPMMINIPWEKVDAAGSRDFADGTGDILFTLSSGEKVSYWMIWPHARPWHFSPVQPMFRGLPDAPEAVRKISQVLSAESSERVEHMPRPPETDMQFPARSRAAAAV